VTLAQPRNGVSQTLAVPSLSSDFTSYALTENGDYYVIPAGSLENVFGGLLAGRGNDTIIGSGSSEIVNAGEGDDVIEGQGGSDILHAGLGNDSISGGDADDILYGGQDSDTIIGGLGFDFINGNKGDDFLYGEAGSDLIRGGQGSDLINGGEGDDTLVGDLGSDTLMGGDGADLFLLNASGEHLDSVDFITDFNPGADLIGISGDLELEDLTVEEVGSDVSIILKSSGQTIGRVTNAKAQEVQDKIDLIDVRPSPDDKILNIGAPEVLSASENEFSLAFPVDTGEKFEITIKQGGSSLFIKDLKLIDVEQKEVFTGTFSEDMKTLETKSPDIKGKAKLELPNEAENNEEGSFSIWDEFDNVITTVPIDPPPTPSPTLPDGVNPACEKLNQFCTGIEKIRNALNFATDAAKFSVFAAGLATLGTGGLAAPALAATVAGVRLLEVSRGVAALADYTCKFLTSPNDAAFMSTLSSDLVTEVLLPKLGGKLLKKTPLDELSDEFKKVYGDGGSILGVGPSTVSLLNLAPSPTEPPKRGLLQQGRDFLKQKFPALSPLLDCANPSSNIPTPTPTPEPSPIPKGQFITAALTDNQIDPGESVKLNVKYHLEGQTAEFLEITGVGKGATSHKFTLPADKTTDGEFSFTLKNDKLTGGIASLKNNLGAFIDAFLVDDQGNDGDSGVFDRIIVNPSAKQIKYDILAPLGDAGIIPTSVTLTSDQGLPFRTFG
jgi:hypothetical protein